MKHIYADCIHYRHKDDDLNKTRYVQYASDPLPPWAVDVQPHEIDLEDEGHLHEEDA